ncbi:phage tail tape measure protein [Microbacterium sp.]|uniref:phage tail tape measure protein n=1 Tax=Microbacterium sp. TaxID=51671 RepID=UPI003C79234C
MGGLLAAGIGVAVVKAAEFDSAMSNVRAATHESTENMDALRQAAIDSGASSVFSATESANAIEELAKAGVSTKDILNGGLNGALDLAAAGGMGVADAAAVAATTLGQFRLEGDQASHVADLLAAGAGKAMGDVSDLSSALAQSGVVAQTFGISVDDTVGTLAAFANAGMLGADAGTSFRTMLLRLSNPTGEAATLMESLGINAYDVGGKFVGMQALAGQLEKGLSGLTQEQRNAAMAVIFGQDAIRGANILYTEGAKGIGEWNDQVNDTGYAAETARIRLDNLKGDVEALGGAFETALIDTGSEANDILRSMVQALTGLVDMYNGLPDGAKQAALMIGGATAAVGLGIGVVSKAVPAWNNLKTAVTGAGWSMRGVVGAGAVAGLALGGLMLIVGEMASKHAEARQKAQSYADTLEESTHKITKATGDLVDENLAAKDSFLWWEQPSAYDRAEDLGVSLGTVKDAALGSTDALKKLKDVQEAADKAYEKSRGHGKENELQLLSRKEATDALVGSVIGENDSINEAIRVSEQKQESDKNSAESAKASADGAKTAAQAYQEQADSTQDLNGQLSKLIDTINKANGVNSDAITANADYEEVIDKVAAQIDKINAGTDGYAKTLDITTQAGRDNMQMLQELAENSQNAAQAQFELDGDTAAYIERLKDGRQKLIDSAKAMGASEDAAQALADQIYKIPSEKEIQFLADTSRAAWTITDFVNRYGSLRGTIEYRAQLPDLNGAASGSGRPGMASGGPVTGPGPKGVDSELRWLAPGEHVLTASDVDALGGQNAVTTMRAGLHSADPTRRSEAVWMETSNRAGLAATQAAPSAPATVGGIRAGDALRLVVDGREFTAFVDARADGRVAARGERLALDLRSGRRRDM